MTYLQVIGGLMLIVAFSAGFTVLVRDLGLPEALKTVVFSLSVTAFICFAAYLITAPV